MKYNFMFMACDVTHLYRKAIKNKQLRYRGEHSASDFRTNWKLICDFLLVINTNLHPIFHRFEVMADYLSNLC